jgi:hypothetical protein
LYAHNTINIQVCHVSKQKYSPWTKLWLLNIFALLIFIALQTLKVTINAYDFFLSLVIVTSLAQWHFIIFVIDEMTSVLQIRVFRVKPKQAA